MSRADELVVSFYFPPSNDVAGIVLAKRHILEGKKFDVIQNFSNDNLDWEFNDLLDEYINERILIESDSNPNFPACTFEFVEKSLKELDKRPAYKKISTRVWAIANNFLALKYKFRHPNVYWKAEFSDPITINIYNKPRFAKYDNCINIETLNRYIRDLNSREGKDFKTVDKSVNFYFLVEYITYLFADEIIFTNKNQRDLMLKSLSDDLKDFVLAKSYIKPHPILPYEYYTIKDYEESLDSSMVNIAYFGNVYSKRHFEMIYHAFEVLNHKFKSKLQFHFYLNDKLLVERLTEGLEISDNIHLKDTVAYLDYLNLTTKFDVLIVNDLITSDCFEVNPYLPSKLSEYLGSGSDIWAIYEKGSTLEKAEVKYKSDVHDFTTNIDVLVRILDDYSFGDDAYTVKDSIEYLQNRITSLNMISYDEHMKALNVQSKSRKLTRQNSKLKGENSKIKKENLKLKNENSNLKNENSKVTSEEKSSENKGIMNRLFKKF